MSLAVMVEVALPGNSLLLGRPRSTPDSENAFELSLLLTPCLSPGQLLRFVQLFNDQVLSCGGGLAVFV